ncbi:hypothetical protein SZ64_14965 [Erythrobacter sp. SG61-1L]|uniref:hypothetical protein n=1 Tax=Erythrobacter sp. SG61-1L TaxID=1603897 RepID=UPI0006C8EAB0|nr:hypothetical protein [Erythrobacter sp. SG61-1L]KPL69290.1 hypothetical protein SZ64_14965 [Erythrobacter sp. SG61-1L]
MRKVIWALAAVSMVIMLVIAMNPPKEILAEKAKEADRNAKAVEAAHDAIRKEPKVEYVLYEGEPANWNIGVFDDGTSRIGYAGYICQVVQEHGAVTPSTQVRIVDVVKVKAGENFRAASLGRMNCASGDTFAR